jgi:hypothetical protein
MSDPVRRVRQQSGGRYSRSRPAATGWVAFHPYLPADRRPAEHYSTSRVCAVQKAMKSAATQVDQELSSDRLNAVSPDAHHGGFWMEPMALPAFVRWRPMALAALVRWRPMALPAFVGWRPVALPAFVGWRP